MEVILVSEWKITLVYFMYAYLYDISIPVSTSVVRKIDILRINFLWQGNCEKRKIHLVNLNTYQSARRKGDWGLKI